jgi:hypothetical protein
MIPLGRGFSSGCYVFDFRIGAGKYFVLLFHVPFQSKRQRFSQQVAGILEAQRQPQPAYA